jgi:hypothetical protein
MRSSDSRLASCSGVVVTSWFACSSEVSEPERSAVRPWFGEISGYWPRAPDPPSLPRLLPLHPLCPVHPCFLPTRSVPFAP